MITDDGLRLIRDMAEGNGKWEWESIGDGLACICSPLIVIAMNKNAAISLVTETLDHRARVAMVEMEVE